MSENALLKSTRSNGVYRLGPPLQVGALHLFEAHDGDGQRCWIKQVPAQDEAAIARLRYEAIIMGKLQHTGVVRLLDRGRNRRCFFLVLGPVGGRSLFQIAESGPLPLHLVLAIAVQLAELLVYLHSQGIICRTLPPEALYVDHLGRVALVDLSAAWDEVSPPRTGAFIPNAVYLSPEEAGGGTAERRSDIYVYGLILFEMLVGRPPFQSSNRGDLALQHLLTPPPNLRELRLDVPPAFADLIQCCLAKAPAQRFASSAALLAALHQMTGPLDEPAEVARSATTPWRWLLRQTGLQMAHSTEERQ